MKEQPNERSSREAKSLPPEVVSKPRHRRIYQAILAGESYLQIGRRFGVSGTTISKMARRWGSPLRRPAQRERIQCLHCGKTLVCLVAEKRKFCSISCSRRYYTEPKTPEAIARRKRARTRTCAWCGKTFLVLFPGNPQRFCSVRCGAINRSKLTAEHQKQLKAALRSKRSHADIANEFGIARSYVQRLAAQWKMPPRKVGRPPREEPRP